ncbi:MAG: M48 family metallopeptidase [Lachnospiraceae bacterium]
MKEYEWIRSGRKTIAIQVKPDGHIVVRSPYRVSRKQVERFLEEKSQWIKTQQEKLRKGEEAKREITDEMRKRGVRMAMELIPERVRYYADIMGISYGRITIREQKTRWGSCSSKGNLNFNWKLMLMPEGVLDYVVVHELAHRIEMNHSKAFWAVVEQVLPDYRKRKALLRETEQLYR